MFQFNFNQTSENSINDDRSEISETIQAKKLKIDEIIPKIRSKLKTTRANSIFDIKYLSTPLFESESLKDISHTDLKPNIYEGGYKIWECTFDLLNFMKDNVSFDSLNVLDLGCGAGLLGLFALQNNASHVYFQDYNQEVLEALAVPNVMLNDDVMVTNESEKSVTTHFNKCNFFCGDWASLTDIVDIQFDIILTSETIYNVNNYSKLIHVFKHLLKPNGSVYLAAKIYYFGVGGCIYDFEKQLEENRFSYETCWAQNEGVKRKIIHIGIKSDDTSAMIAK